MKMLKRILKLLLLAILFIIISGFLYLKYFFFKPSANQLLLQNTNITIPFVWESDTSNNIIQLYAAMLLPVKLNGCPKTFYMQFDLGASSSIFYKNKIDAINQKFKNIPVENNSKNQLTNFTFHLNELLVTAKKINVKQFDDAGINWLDTTKNEVIGTIGSDLIENKILIIDYPRHQISFCDKLPDSISAKANLSKLEFVNRKVFIPCSIGGKKTDLVFDTGSSSWELVTTKSTWTELAKKGEKVNIFMGNSWGKQSPCYTTATDSELVIGKNQLPLKNVTYTRGSSWMQNILLPIFMKAIGVGGLTGNKLFLSKTIIIDTKNSEFGIMK